jgi:hypothetical protein
VQSCRGVASVVAHRGTAVRVEGVKLSLWGSNPISDDSRGWITGLTSALTPGPRSTIVALRRTGARWLVVEGEACARASACRRA